MTRASELPRDLVVWKSAAQDVSYFGIAYSGVSPLSTRWPVSGGDGRGADAPNCLISARKASAIVSLCRRIIS